MSYIGINSMGKLILGTTEIAKAYLGTQLVFQSGSGPTPPPVVIPVFYNYIYFDGTAYIETNYVLPENCSIRVGLGMETSKAAQGVFGALGSNNGTIGMFYAGGTNSTRRQVAPYYDSESLLVSNRYLSFTYSSFGYFMTPSRFGWGTTAYTYTKGSKHPDGGVIFGTHYLLSSVQKYTGRMSMIRIYGSDASGVTTDAGFDNYTPVATFRPCTYNGVPGLWYVEGNAFFGNAAGSGVLTVSDS